MPAMIPDLSVIIPVFNRGTVIRHTLESVRRASAGLTVETIIVDDGSTPPTAEVLTQIGFTPSVAIRQSNQGLLFARLAGLERATGRNVLFLDSDDLVSVEKFRLQLAAMAGSQSDVSYSDTAHCEINDASEPSEPTPDLPSLRTTDVAEFCIIVQPPPHSPIFRTAWLRQVVAAAFFPPSPLYNSVAEIWFYHNAATQPGQVVHVPGPHTIVGSHPGARLTNHWEKLGVASLAVMEAFGRASPPAARRPRELVGAKAFGAWRRLPRGVPAEFEARLLGVWRDLGDDGVATLGGPVFQQVARAVGAERAARMFRFVQAGRYDGCRTMTDAEFVHLLRGIPPRAA